MMLKNSPDNCSGAGVADRRARPSLSRRLACSWARLIAWFEARPPALRLTVVTLVSLVLWVAIVFGVVAAIG
jgi:hypothetical protein